MRRFRTTPGRRRVLRHRPARATAMSGRPQGKARLILALVMAGFALISYFGSKQYDTLGTLGWTQEGLMGYAFTQLFE